MKVRTVDRYIKRVLNCNKVKENHQKAVILYTLRLCDFVEFGKLTSDLTAAQRKDLRMGIRSNANLVLYFKINVCRAIQTGKFEGNPLDANIIRLLKDWKYYEKLKTKLKGVSVKSPEQYKRECGTILSQLKTYISKYVYAKFRFIVMGHNFEFGDFITQLTYNAIQAYYHEIPFKSGLYLANSMRTKVKNDGTNLILHYTRQKNMRMTEEDGKYVGTTISINQSSIDGEEFDILEKTDVEQPNQYDLLDSRMTLNSISKRYIKANGEKGKKYEALLIMCMYDDPKFIEWYNQTHGTKYESTESIYCKFKDNRFGEVVRQYFKATQGSWNSFMDELKNLLTEG